MTKIRQSQSYEACLCWGFLLPAPAPGAFRWWCLGPTGWYQWAELVDTLLNLPRMSPNWKLAYIILVCLLPLLFSWHQSVCSVCSCMLCPWGSLGTYQHLSTLLLPSSFLCCLVYKWLIFKCSSWSVFQLTEVWRSASHWIKITGKHPNTSEHHR